MILLIELLKQEAQLVPEKIP